MKKEGIWKDKAGTGPPEKEEVHKFNPDLWGVLTSSPVVISGPPEAQTFLEDIATLFPSDFHPTHIPVRAQTGAEMQPFEHRYHKIRGPL